MASCLQHSVQFDRPEIWTSDLPLHRRKRYRSTNINNKITIQIKDAETIDYLVSNQVPASSLLFESSAFARKNHAATKQNVKFQQEDSTKVKIHKSSHCNKFSYSNIYCWVLMQGNS